MSKLHGLTSSLILLLTLPRSSILHDAPDDSEQACSITAIKRQIARAGAPQEAGRLYAALFEEARELDVEALMRDNHIGIAMQAAWEKHIGSNQSYKRRFRSDSVHRFLGFLEGAGRITTPSWWADTLAAAVPHDRSAIYYPEPTGWEYVATELGMIKRDYRVVRKSKDVFAIKTSQASMDVSTSIEKTIQESRLPPKGRHVSLCLSRERLFLGIHSDAGFPFTLVCVRARDGAKRWSADVWAAGRNKLSGKTSHFVEISEQGKLVVVWGAESHGMYVEAFDSETGNNLFRFCTSLWFVRNTKR
jgi:hypothetical protein